MGHRQILVVEDDHNVRDLLIDLLGAIHDVRPARSGAEALAILKAADLALIVLDYLLPDRTGLEVLAEIRVRQPSLAASQPVRGVAIAVATRLKVSTQEIWSWVADSAPLSLGMMTVTLVAVRPNRTVVNCTDSRISHWRPVMVMPRC